MFQLSTLMPCELTIHTSYFVILSSINILFWDIIQYFRLTGQHALLGLLALYDL